MSVPCRSLAHVRPAVPLVALLASAIATAGAADRPLTFGVTGSTPAEARSDPTQMLAFEDVQRLLIDIAARPKARTAIERTLADKDFTVDDMVRVGLLREQDDVFHIDFNLLLDADLRAINQVSQRLGRDLAQAVLAERERFERLAAERNQPGVDPSETLLIVLGCFSLDWDGLRFTEERGYRQATQRTIDGHRFTPWARETRDPTSLKGLYWGSHNESASRFTFTTFGDHYSLPRVGLPDIAWRGELMLATDAQSAGHARGDNPKSAAQAARLLDDIAEVVASLRFGTLQETDLYIRTGIEAERVAAILALLVSIGYVERDGDTIRPRTVVLTDADDVFIQKTLRAGRRLIEAWHAAHYETIRAELSQLTPQRHGVPFERTYTEIWHYIFGTANRVLVEEGLFADPYAEERRFKGFLPAIWANGLDAYRDPQ